MNSPVTKWGKADPYRWELTNQIAAILHANGTNVRPFNTSVKSVADIPKGGMIQLIDEVPFDGVRAEVKGTTVSVEITQQRKGDVSTADQIRFACYELEAFRDWFYNLLRRTGHEPAPGLPINLLKGYYHPTHTGGQLIRPALSPIRHTKKRKR